MEEVNGSIPLQSTISDPTPKGRISVTIDIDVFSLNGMKEQFAERQVETGERAGDLLRADIHELLVKAARASKERGNSPRRGIPSKAISTVRGFDSDPKRRTAFKAVENSLHNTAEDDDAFLVTIEDAMITFFNTFTKQELKQEIPKVFWLEKPPKFLQDFLAS